MDDILDFIKKSNEKVNGCQWIGDGNALYRILDGSNFNDKKEIFAAYDFSEKLKEKVFKWSIVFMY